MVNINTYLALRAKADQPIMCQDGWYMPKMKWIYLVHSLFMVHGIWNIGIQSSEFQKKKEIQ